MCQPIMGVGRRIMQIPTPPLSWTNPRHSGAISFERAIADVLVLQILFFQAESLKHPIIIAPNIEFDNQPAIMKNTRSVIIIIIIIIITNYLVIARFVIVV